MKKIIFTLILLILIPVTVLAWDDCPYNETACPFPGDCHRYIDTDNDRLCDRSQVAPEDRNGKVASVDLREREKNIALLTKAEPPAATSKPITIKNKKIYHLVPISLFLIFLYLVSHVLSKKKIISIVSHRKIWNVLLLATFLVSGIFGILLVIEINFGITIPLPFNILFWHVEIGIAMTVISVFHTLWHWPYFKNLLTAPK